MKLSIILLLGICINATAKVSAQQINLKEVNAHLETVFKEIEKQTNYTFIYTKELLKKASIVNVEINNLPLNEALRLMFLGQPLDYTMYKRTIVIKEVAQQTYSISGTVKDENGTILTGVIVFITNTKKATSTDGYGKFILNGLPTGDYELVAKMVGFTNHIETIKIKDKSININIKLKESNTLLNVVTIKAIPPGKQSKRDLKSFIKNFIGTSVNAAQCKILNPEVLNLHPGKKGQYILEANADDFLIIENDALGYKIKYLLKKFIYYYKYDICYYDGSPYFEELEGNEQQKKQWANNRRKAYMGSYRHFFRSVMNNTSRTEGFYTYVLNKSAPWLKPFNIDSLAVTINKDHKEFILKPYGTLRPDLYIYYTRIAYEEYEDIKNVSQLTWVTQCIDTVMIDKNGSTSSAGYELFNSRSAINGNRGITDGVGFSFWGKWTYQRVADMTPLDYFAEQLPDEYISDKYHLVAIDAADKQSISYFDRAANDFKPVIKENVFAAGYNNKYIIAQQHPNNSNDIVNYYILPLKGKKKTGNDFGLIGPLSLNEFEQKRKELKLEGVNFSIVHNDVEQSKQ
ncbi:carboxypeptidase-like regulatory domain-containing protein [Mucilaginibacter sp.]|uniref:carboxypeptidase-like regulatory domain-containing protein n=1 Tax=Mucilaginibacter sp. TaxID=1882438 RepID=UPI002613FD5E|nr:carboxypeptidase-like regulatory domain-containing protein [Mucilaginibacter sp.]MDB4924007.1 hypothetical protein [Mucilaginibacter sp.]